MSKRNIQPFSMVSNAQGMNQKSMVFNASAEYAEHIENMHTTAPGVFAAHEQGYREFPETYFSGQAILGLTSYLSAAGQATLIAAGDEHVLALNTSGELQSVLADGINFTSRPDFELFQEKLVMTQAGANPLYWPGYGNLLPLSGFPVVVGLEQFEKPAIVERHLNRLAYADFHGAVHYPSHLVFSEHLTVDSFTIGLNDTDASVIQVAPGDGQKITAMKSLHVPASNDTVLIIFKERSVYALKGDTPSSYAISLVSNDIGALNNRCVVQVGNDLIFLDRHRISALSVANDSGNLHQRSLSSDRVQKTLDEINLSAADQCFAIHLPSRQEVWFGLPTQTSQVVNKILVYRYALSGDDASAWSIRTGFSPTVPLLTHDDQLLMGLQHGKIAQFFRHSQYGDSPYNWVYRYPFYHFKNQLCNKHVLECFAWFLAPSPFTVTIKTEWRGGGSATKHFIDKTVSPTGGAVYSDDAPPGVLYGQAFYQDIPLVKVRLPVWGNGEQLRVELSGSSTASGAPIFLGLTGLVEFLDDSRSYR